MRKALGPLALLIALGAFAPLNAMASLELAKSKNCMTCHAIDKKVIGPAYQDVANKFAGQKGIEDQLAERILKGSQGVWGQIPMPPNTNVSPAEAKTLAHWIMGMAKKPADQKPAAQKK